MTSEGKRHEPTDATAGPRSAGASAELVAIDDPAWCSFVRAHPDASPFHHPAWSTAIAETYRFAPFALLVRSPDGDVLGGMPLIAIDRRLRGTRWVSLPFTDVCGPLTVPELPEHELAQLLVAIQHKEGVKTVEARASVRSDLGVEVPHGVVHTLALSDPDSLFRAFKPQVRRNIRKAERSGVSVRAAEQREELTTTYFALHAETHRRLGLPTQPRRFFETLWSHLIDPGLGVVLLAYREDVPVAGAVFLQFNGRLVYKYGASDSRHWALRPNNLLFWEAIRRGYDTGALTLDFGRTDSSAVGLRDFKRSWGAVETPLTYTAFGKAPRGWGQAGRLAGPVLRVAPTWVSRGIGALMYRRTA